MKQYIELVRHVLANGTRKPNRTGVDTISTFNYNYEIDLADGFPLLTTKKMSWKNIVIEALWFLSGRTDVATFHKHGIHFWDPWVGNNGRIYGQYGEWWRSFPTITSANDQIDFVLNELKNNPMSRRMVVSAWYPEHGQTSKLPPCHCMFIFNVQLDDQGNKRLCCHLTQRSCDVALGVPYNIASYSLLTHIMGKLSGIKPWLFAHTCVDAHIYTKKEDGSMQEYDHIPGLMGQIFRRPVKLPELVISDDFKSIDDADKILDLPTDEILKIFHLTGYDPAASIPFKVAV